MQITSEKIIYGLLGAILGFIIGLFLVTALASPFIKDNGPHLWLFWLDIIPIVIGAYIGILFSKSTNFRQRTTYALAGLFITTGSYALIALILNNGFHISILNGWIMLVVAILGLLSGVLFRGKYHNIDIVESQKANYKKKISGLTIWVIFLLSGFILFFIWLILGISRS